MFETLKDELKTLVHTMLEKIEAAEVAAQQVTSTVVDQTGPGPGADVLNAGEAAQHEGDDPPTPPAPSPPEPPPTP